MSFRIRGKVGLGETRSCLVLKDLESQDQGPVKVTHLPTINAMHVLSWVPKETLSTHPSPRFSLWFKDKDPSVGPVLSILLPWNFCPQPRFIIEGVFFRYQRLGSLLCPLWGCLSFSGTSAREKGQRREAMLPLFSPLQRILTALTTFFLSSQLYPHQHLYCAPNSLHRVQSHTLPPSSKPHRAHTSRLWTQFSNFLDFLVGHTSHLSFPWK